MTRAQQLKQVIYAQRPGAQELNAQLYRRMRLRQVALSMQEHKTATGQGCGFYA